MLCTSYASRVRPGDPLPGRERAGQRCAVCL